MKDALKANLNVFSSSSSKRNPIAITNFVKHLIVKIIKKRCRLQGSKTTNIDCEEVDKRKDTCPTKRLAVKKTKTNNKKQTSFHRKRRAASKRKT